ncbi:MAG: ABC transporter ATP-binding protein [Arenicella sp.]
MAEILINDVKKQYGDFHAVKGSSFTIDDGDFFVMLGPSGCGKTTTLRMIAGLEMPSSGQICLGGEDVTYLPASQRDTAFVFQMFALYPHMNVEKNIGFPLRCQGFNKAQIREKVGRIAEILQITHLLKSPVGGLSSGDRQRVALGRSIVRDPKAFLMDEPLGALDTEFRHVMCNELRDLHNEMKATTVYVTHDQLEAMSMADKILVMNHGTIEQIGSPQQLYDHPMSMFVADFLGDPSMSFLPFSSQIAAGDSVVRMSQDVLVDAPKILESFEGTDFCLGIRPEHVSFDDGSPLKGQIFAVEYFGTTQVAVVKTDFGMIKARVPVSYSLSIDEIVGLKFDTKSIVIFDATSGRALKNEVYERVGLYG